MFQYNNIILTCNPLFFCRSWSVVRRRTSQGRTSSPGDRSSCSVSSRRRPFEWAVSQTISKGSLHNTRLLFSTSQHSFLVLFTFIYSQMSLLSVSSTCQLGIGFIRSLEVLANYLFSVHVISCKFQSHNISEQLQNV